MLNAVKNFAICKERLLVIILLLLLALQGIASLRYKSPTCDEVIHIPIGYTQLKTLDFRLCRETPPLIEMIAALPLTLLNPKIPTDHPSWHNPDMFTFGKQFLYVYNQNADQLVLWGRIPVLLLSLLLGFFVFKWSKELYGLGAGFLALFLYVFEPNILAHSRLATVDLGATCFIFVAFYFFWCFLKEPTGKKLILAGITLGLALASKFSAILLIPIYAILVLIYGLKPKRANHPHLQQGRRLFASLLTIFLLGFLVIFVSYGCQLKPAITSSIAQQKLEKLISSESTTGQLAHRILASVPVPALDWFKGLNTMLEHSGRGHAAFLMGMHSTKGWWHYFIVAFLIKTPIPLLILLPMMAIFFRQIKSKDTFDELFLIMPAGFLFLASLFSHINIGLRHILPIYPFLFVFVSKLVRVRVRGQTLFALSVVLLCFWYLFSSLSIYPHYLAYFNEFVGGPDNGYKYLVDSNLDWGQDLKGLANYVRDRDIEEIKLSYFGTASPDYYHIPYREITEKEAHQHTPGIYAISATNLQNVYDEDKTRFAWLKRYEPIDKIGYSTFIYDVD